MPVITILVLAEPAMIADVLIRRKLKYSKEHTWVKVEGDAGIIGITEFGQSELGEIVYVDLPAIGKKYAKDEVFGSVEAVKTTSDLFMLLEEK